MGACTQAPENESAIAGDGSTPARAGAGKRNPPKGGSIRRRHSDVASGRPREDAEGAGRRNPGPGTSRPSDRPGPIVTAAMPPRKPPPVLR